MSDLLMGSGGALAGAAAGGPFELAAQAAKSERAMQRNTSALELLRSFYTSSSAARLFAGQAENRAGATLADLRAQANTERFNAARMATPQGRAETEQRLAFEQSIRDSRLRQAQDENIVRYGRLGGTLANIDNQFGRGLKAIEPFVKGLGIAGVAFNALIAAGYSAAAAASPSSAATLNTSSQIAAASIGQRFGLWKVLDQGSYFLQQFANYNDQQRTAGGQGGTGGGPWGAFVRGAVAFTSALGPYGPIEASRAFFHPEAAKAREAAFDKRVKEGTLFDIDPRLQSKAFGSFEEYGKAFQTAGLNSTNQMASNDLLRRQLEVLAEQGGLLTSIDRSVGKMASQTPLFS